MKEALEREKEDEIDMQFIRKYEYKKEHDPDCEDLKEITFEELVKSL